MPYPTPSSEVNINSTFGIVFLAVALSSMIYGATCLQIFSYFYSARSKQDPSLLRYGVLALMLVDTFQQVLILHVGYYYLIVHFGQRDAPLTSLPWSVPTEALLLAISALLFNIFLTARLWRLSQNVALSALATILTIVTAGASMSFAIRGYEFNSLILGLRAIQPHGIAALCLSIVTECALSAAVACHLHKGRSGLQRHDNFLTKVIILTVTTGMLTTPFNIAALVTYVVSTKSLTVVLLNFLLAKRTAIPLAFTSEIGTLTIGTFLVYAYAFITTLNMRQYLLNLAVEAYDPESFPMSHPLFNVVPSSVLSTSDVPRPAVQPIGSALSMSLTPPDAVH